MATATYEFTETLDDSVPPLLTVEHACEVCGRDVQWKGRGRVPKTCPEHRKQQSTGRTRETTNDKLAAQAVEVLVASHAILELFLTILQFTDTVEQFQRGEDVFRERAFAALKADAKLCRSIISSGGLPAKVNLAFAYGVLVAPCVPVAVGEFKDMRAIRRERREQS